MPALGRIKDSLRPVRRRADETDRNPAVATCLGPMVPGFVPPMPSRSNIRSAEFGMCKRLGADNGVVPRATLDRLRKFTQEYCERNFTPLATDALPTIRLWLDQSNYPAKRRSDLMEIATRAGFDVDDNGVGALDRRRASKVNSFVKAEFYRDVKAPRLICSRSDYAKCFYGPLAAAIEHGVYNTDHHFIKHVPVPDRPRYVSRIVGDGKVVVESDYSAFECHFTKDLMHAVEFVLYRYFLQNIHNYHGLDLGSEEGFNQAFAPISETNKICLLGNVYSVAATRMSGEMFTSLGNGFTNLMVMLCFMEECGISGVDGVVEGDDGLYAVPQRFADRIPDTKFFADRGFNVKLAVRESVNEATFCSMVFDSETLHVLKEPTFALARLGWVPRPYIGKRAKRLGLLRAKLTSLLYECSCCPILGAAAFHGLRLTSGVLADWSLLLRSSYYRDELLAAMRFDCSRLPVPSPGDRKLFSKHFNISEEEQLRIEQEFAECEDIDRLLSGRYLRLLFERLAPPSWQLTSDQFTEILYRGEPVELINRPERVNPQCHVDVGLSDFIDRCSPPAHHTEPDPT